MAAINDLIARIQDPELRLRMEKEVKELTKHKKFGLVFENHVPEMTLLYDYPISRSCKVIRKADDDKKLTEDILWEVRRVSRGVATCRHSVTGEEQQISCQDLICVARNGEPIYPCLKYLDSVQKAPDSDLWHTLIEADNFHALQLLAYLYPQQVDCIYIDPPYNSGATDWKYNNNYVDGNDSYRHSKWLAMMESRLLLAKKLLNPKNSVLIVTIDENEYVHLGCLLEELFPEANIQMISSVINPAGVSIKNGFSRTNEFLYFVKNGKSSPTALTLGKDWRGNIKGGYKDKLRWNGLQRSGTSVLRTDRYNMFYPIYLSKDGKKIVSIGESIPLGVDRHTIECSKDCIQIWPLFPDGREGRWRLGRDTLIDYVKKHYVKIGMFRGESTSISYLAQGEQIKVEKGKFPIVGYNEDGSVIVDESDYQASFVPGSQWWISSHDATQLGTKILR